MSTGVTNPFYYSPNVLYGLPVLYMDKQMFIGVDCEGIVRLCCKEYSSWYYNPVQVAVATEKDFYYVDDFQYNHPLESDMILSRGSAVDDYCADFRSRAELCAGEHAEYRDFFTMKYVMTKGSDTYKVYGGEYVIEIDTKSNKMRGERPVQFIQNWNTILGVEWPIHRQIITVKE